MEVWLYNIMEVRMAQQIDLLKNTSFEGKMDSLIEAILKGEN